MYNLILIFLNLLTFYTINIIIKIPRETEFSSLFKNFQIPLFKRWNLKELIKISGERIIVLEKCEYDF